MPPAPRTVLLYRHLVGGRKKLISSGRFQTGFTKDEALPEDEQRLTVLNFIQPTGTLVFEIKPHDIGTIIEGLIHVVSNNNILPKKELLGNIIGAMPYGVIAEMINLLPVEGRQYVRDRIQT